MNRTAYSITGKVWQDVELDDVVFGLLVNQDVILYAINDEFTNKITGTARTRDRERVYGSNAKPYPPTGTGRAQ
jgi:ribosomal protein L4